MKRSSSLFAILAVFVWSCGDSKLTCGGVDGNPNFLQGHVSLPANSSSAENVAVVLSESVGIRMATRSSEASWSPVDTTFTDASGNYRFPLAQNGTFRIDALVGDSTLFVGTFLHQASKGTRLDFQVPLPESDGLLFDDFESAPSTSLSKWFKNAHPWILHFRDTLVDILPAELDTSTTSLVVDTCGAQGKCMAFSTILNVPGGIYAFNGFLIPIPFSSQGCVDLSKADWMSLRVRGEGELSVFIWVGRNDDPSIWMDLEFNRTLTKDWTTQNLKLADTTFHLKRNSVPVDVQWNQLCVHKFLVGLRGVGSIQADDIRMKGITQLDITGK